MEKRRRARINQSLNELKKLLLNGSTCKKEVFIIHMFLMLRVEILSLEALKMHDFIIKCLIYSSHNTKLAPNVLHFCCNKENYVFTVTIPLMWAEAG
jgi:hypothetical protein